MISTYQLHYSDEDKEPLLNLSFDESYKLFKQYNKDGIKCYLIPTPREWIPM